MMIDEFASAFILVFLVFWLIVSIISFIFLIMSIIGLWKMFTKAGKEGWKALIPIYNLVVLCEIVGISPYWILIVFVCALLNVVPVVGQLLSLAASIYFAVILSVSIAKSYGKSDDYAIGIFLLTPIFYMILGMGSSIYQGPKPMNDPVYKWLEELFGKKNQTSTNSSNANNNVGAAEILNESAVRYCGKCGTKVAAGENFCVNCGNKLN